MDYLHPTEIGLAVVVITPTIDSWFPFKKLNLPTHNPKSCNFSMLDSFICIGELIGRIPNRNIDGVNEAIDALSV